MKKNIIISLIILLVLYVTLIQRVSVDAGMEAVIIKKPWFSQKSGVENQAISTGTIWAVSSTTIKLISLKPFEINEKFSDVLTQENLPISFNINMTFQQQKGKAPLLIKAFGENNEWYKTLLLPSLKVSIESAIKSSQFQTLLKNSTGIQTLEKSAALYVQNILQTKNIPINLLQFHFTKITPPQKLIEAAMQTEMLKQQAKSKEEKINIELIRKKLHETRAKADKAYMLTMNMSVQQYLRMKKLELEEKKLMNQRYVIDQAKDSNGSIEIKVNIK